MKTTFRRVLLGVAGLICLTSVFAAGLLNNVYANPNPVRLACGDFKCTAGVCRGDTGGPCICKSGDLAVTQAFPCS